MKTFKTISVALGALSLCPLAAMSAETDPYLDHFAPRERVDPKFDSGQGAWCTFGDLQVVLYSDWKDKLWIKLDGKQVEVRGDVVMKAEGWFQAFTGADVTVELSLRRTGDHGESVPMVGTIKITRPQGVKSYAVSGDCGA